MKQRAASPVPASICGGITCSGGTSGGGGGGGGSFGWAETAGAPVSGRIAAPVPGVFRIILRYLNLFNFAKNIFLTRVHPLLIVVA